MSQLLKAILVQASDLNYVLLIGTAILAGLTGAWIVQKLRIPQVVGYVTIGVILGPALGFIPQAAVQSLELFNMVALGIIGFLVGAELKREIFAKFGKQVFAILLFEGGVAFLLVTVISFLALNYFYDWQTALAVGVVFGAICSATDPASTINVLWEYKTRGPLASMLITIVALDDALALVLYITGISIASFLTGHKEFGVLPMIFHSLYEVIGSLGLGIATGLILRWILGWIGDDEKTLIFTLGSVMLTIGLAIAWKLDVILSSMACGVTLINLSPRAGLKSFELVRRFSPPIYILFFVVIGARLKISLSGQIWLLAATYVVGTAIGKTAGSYWGSVYAKAVPTIRKYLGFCLYQQGTIALALLIMASSRFEGHIKDTMLSVIIIGVFILQLIGPIFVKMGVKKAGELGLNVTEDDLIKTYKVSDVMETDVPVIAAGASLSDVLKTVSSTNHLCYCVVNDEKKVVGAITLDDIRNTFAAKELSDWLIALDIAESVVDVVTSDMALSKAIELMKQDKIEYMPVVLSQLSNVYAGVLNSRAMHRRLSAEILSKQQQADSMYIRKTK